MSSDLVPHCVLPRLTTTWLGNPYLHEKEVDSTNTRMNAMALAGGTHGTVLVAEYQTQGRGRQGRSWHSPAGENLIFSVLLRPRWPVNEGPPVSLAVGVALAETVELLLSEAPELKWPNDLLWQGRKLAGILVEVSVNREQGSHITLGIGLNVNQLNFPASIAEHAVSMRLATGNHWNRAEVLAILLGRLESWMDHLAKRETDRLISSWQRFAPWIGQRIHVRGGKRELVGTALGLDPQGALRLQDPQGKVHSIVTGEVQI
jgi:BirA family biotin operon repressor/biotin-[acetyl-CoA-carboxylase] ligase